MTDLEWTAPPDDGRPVMPKKCRRHEWVERPTGRWYEWDGVAWKAEYLASGYLAPAVMATLCARCGRLRDEPASRRGRNARKRGTSDELTVARIIGGEKVGPLGLPWDVTIPGYLRAQSKQLDRWPSLAKVIEWLDAIPQGAELRAVTLADTPGPGHRTRRLIVFDLAEWAQHHGRVTE